MKLILIVRTCNISPTIFSIVSALPDSSKKFLICTCKSQNKGFEERDNDESTNKRLSSNGLTY